MSADTEDFEMDITAGQKMISAMSGSLLTSLLVTPLDVVRVRLQSQPQPQLQQSPLTDIHKLAHSTRTFNTLPPNLGVTACCREVFFANNNAEYCMAIPKGGGAIAGAECAVEETQRKTFNSTFDGLRKIARNEGITTLWRGLSPTLVMTVPANIIYFTGYDWLRFNKQSPINRFASDNSAPLLAGATARVFAAGVVSPIEMFRTRMQASRATGGTHFAETVSGMGEMIANSGYKSLWRGLTLTLWRDVPFSGIYWWGYESIRGALSEAREKSRGQAFHKDERSRARSRSQSQKNHKVTFIDSFVAGASSGAVASILTMPFDVGKTRRQVFKESSDVAASVQKILAPEERSMPRFLWHILREEGLSGLWRGWIPRTLKVAPACAIMISSYELFQARYFKALLIFNSPHIIQHYNSSLTCLIKPALDITSKLSLLLVSRRSLLTTTIMSLKRKASNLTSSDSKKPKADGSITSFFGAPKPNPPTSSSSTSAPLPAANFNKEKWIATLTEEQKRLLKLEIETLHESWLKELKDEVLSREFLELKRFLKREVDSGKVIYPPMEDVYSWSRHTPLNTVKAVIIGQDPYHNVNQAHGLSFSVRPPTPAPASLKNIYIALKKDYPSFTPPPNKGGLLTPWADRGVLLLNTCLTVRAHEANSHSNRGWERFTQKVIDLIAAKRTKGVVFLAWGTPAGKRVAKVDRKRHEVLMSVHPSPLSASRGWYDCGHFKKTNEWLVKRYGEGAEINWDLGGAGMTTGLQEAKEEKAEGKYSVVVNQKTIEAPKVVEKKVEVTKIDEFGDVDDEDALEALAAVEAGI
ncbi:hypothetical protein B7494_g36 [Chlorociboria aeruginascens]|nr:hypothetical protein B7494_g36 [Chlorociboria aeruginascens]